MSFQSSKAPSRQTLFEFISNAGYTVIAWIGLFELNAYLFEGFVVNQNVSWVFLPAVVRMLAVLLAGYAGVVGLFFGALFTNLPINSVELLDVLMLTSITALNPLLAVWIVVRYFGINHDLSGLRWWHLILFATAGAVSNVVLTQSYLALSLRHDAASGSWFPMLVGDLVGTFVILYAASLIVKLTNKICA